MYPYTNPFTNPYEKAFSKNPLSLNQFSPTPKTSAPQQVMSVVPKQVMNVVPKEELEKRNVAGAKTTAETIRKLFQSGLKQLASRVPNRTITPTQAQAQSQTKAKAQPSKPRSVISDAEQEYQKKLNQELEKAYKSGISKLESDISSLTQRQPELETQVATGFEELVPGIQKQRETALAEARRQYETGLQRGQQVFGGVAGSSAAQAVQDVASQELLRQTGGIQTQTAEALNKLNIDKQNALNTLRLDFRKQLDAINAQRYELSAQKSNAQLQALQDFANRRRNVEDFYTQRQASIEDQLRAAALARSVATPKQASYLTSLGFDDATRKQAIDSFIRLGEGYLARQNLKRAVLNGREVLQDTKTGETFDVDTGANITIY